MTTWCLNPGCPASKNPDDAVYCGACGAKLRLGDRFRPIRLLGQGGFGRTFLALDEAHTPPQRCVLKQSLREKLDAARFYQEAERLAQLGQHPQIPALIAVLESTTGLCLVQEYIPGPTLAQVLAAEGPFQEAQVRSLLTSLLPVLQFVHKHWVIHRDIKPTNILRPAPDQPLVLVDFGAAKAVRYETTPSQTGTVIGSAGYAAPEQVLGKAVFASDLYSLGVTCLHLLTGRHPFDLYSVAEDRWVWRPYAAHPVSLRLVQVLERLAARSLRTRYPSATAALADLEPAGGSLAKTAARSGWPHRKPPAAALSAPTPWRCQRVIPTPGYSVNALAVSPDGRAIAGGSSDSALRLWDLHSGELIHTLTRRLGVFGGGHSDEVTAVCFAIEGDTLFSGGRDGTLKHWDLGRYQLLTHLDDPGWVLTALLPTPDGQALLSAAEDGQVKLWRLPDFTLQRQLVRHQGTVNDLALSADGKRFASVGNDGTLRLWALPSGQLLHTWVKRRAGLPGKLLEADDGRDRLLSVRFHPHQPLLFTGSVHGDLDCWSLADLGTPRRLAQQGNAITALALTAAGGWLASGSDDGQTHLWDLGSLQPVAVVKHDWAVRDLAFTPDGRILVSSAADETIRLWLPLSAAAEGPEAPRRSPSP